MPETKRGWWVRGELGFLATVAAVVGAWASFAPRSFYDTFPGGGHHWVSPDGPFNEHLVRDVGELNLALAVLSVVALVSLAPLVARTAAVAWIVYGVPHLAYHARHLDPFSTGDGAMLTVALVLPVLVAVGVLVGTRGVPADAPAR